MVRKASKLREANRSDAVECEADLHHAVWAECRRRRWQALHGSMSEATSRTKGEPDFIILADKGRVFFVECKTRTGKLSPVQQAFKVGASFNGHTVHTIRSMTEFLNVVDTNQSTQL